MSSLSRFIAAASLVAAPLLFPGCREEVEVLPTDQEITGTATDVWYERYYFGSSLDAIYIHFKDTQGKAYSLSLKAANKYGVYAESYEADVEVSCDNFLRPESTALIYYDQRIETKNNLEYNINVTIAPGKEMQVGHNASMGGFKSFKILVPSNALSIIDYGFDRESEVWALFRDRDLLSKVVEGYLDDVKNSPYLPPEGSMGFSIDLKLQ